MRFLVISAFILIAVYEIPGLVRKKYWKEVLIFILFLIPAFVLSFLFTIGVDIPSPGILIKYLVKDVLHVNYE